MIKQNNQELESPIIIVQDSSYGNVSTTNDVLTQTDLSRYSSNLKGVDLDQFMQMTDARDFKHFGIRKQKDCRKLSTIAQSIRRSSLSSSSFDDDDDIYDTSDSEDISLAPTSNTSAAAVNSEGGDARVWPNSKSPRLARLTTPDYDNSRRFSVPSLSPPKYSVLDQKPRRHSCADIEKLPKYSCTVQKIGKGSAKFEYDLPNVRARRRSWRDVYMELQGTVLKVYQLKSSSSMGGYYLPTITPYYQDSVKYSPLVDLSLANAQVDSAVDYTKKPNVFRVKTENGPQILFQVQTNAAALLWIEKISAGCNIAVDLESQRMPRFPSMSFIVEPSGVWNSENQSIHNYTNEDTLRRDSQPDDSLL